MQNRMRFRIVVSPGWRFVLGLTFEGKHAFTNLANSNGIGTTFGYKKWSDQN